MSITNLNEYWTSGSDCFATVILLDIIYIIEYLYHVFKWR